MNMQLHFLASNLETSILEKVEVPYEMYASIFYNP